MNIVRLTILFFVCLLVFNYSCIYTNNKNISNEKGCQLLFDSMYLKRFDLDSLKPSELDNNVLEYKFYTEDSVYIEQYYYLSDNRARIYILYPDSIAYDQIEYYPNGNIKSKATKINYSSLHCGEYVTFDKDQNIINLSKPNENIIFSAFDLANFVDSLGLDLSDRRLSLDQFWEIKIELDIPSQLRFIKIDPYTGEVIVDKVWLTEYYNEVKDDLYLHFAPDSIPPLFDIDSFYKKIQEEKTDQICFFTKDSIYIIQKVHPAGCMEWRIYPDSIFYDRILYLASNGQMAYKETMFHEKLPYGLFYPFADHTGELYQPIRQNDMFACNLDDIGKWLSELGYGLKSEEIWIDLIFDKLHPQWKVTINEKDSVRTTIFDAWDKAIIHDEKVPKYSSRSPAPF